MKKQWIWIMTDTTRFDLLGCYGNSAMHTPCLDSMSEKGMRFDRAYSAQPVCGPARSALFTGQFPHSNGSWANSMPLGADVKTLGQYLSAKGIPCAYIGKWHLDGGDYFGNGVCPDGWNPDYWYDMRNYLDELTPEERVIARNDASTQKGVAADFTFAYRITKRALDFVEKYHDQDFFLVVSYDEPHDPCLCPPPFSTMYDDYEGQRSPAYYDTLENKPLYQSLWANGANKVDRDQVKCIDKRILRCNSYVDSLIGEILDKTRELAPDAMKMFTSDHGDANNAHCLKYKGPAIYDEIARVPLLFEGPGVPKGSVYSHTVSHIDLPATVMEWMDGYIPVAFQGESLLPQLNGNLGPTGRPVYVEFNRFQVNHDNFGGFQPMRAIITDEYKLAIHLTDTDEFYERKTDEWDLNNRIDDPSLADIRNDLHEELLQWMNTTRDPFRGYQWRCRSWRPDFEPKWQCDGYTRSPAREPGESPELDYDNGLPIKSNTRKA